MRKSGENCERGAVPPRRWQWRCGSSGAGGVVVVAVVVVVVAAVWRCCWCYLGVYAGVYWWDTHFGGAVVLALSSATSRPLFLAHPPIHRGCPLCHTNGGHRTESDRARPGTTQDGCVSLTRARQTRHTRGKRQPGDKRNMLLRDRRTRP